MNNQKPIIQNPQTVEIVQEVEKNQEKEVKKPDHIIIEIESEEGEKIYEAQPTDEIIQEKFSYTHEANPRLPDTPFWVKIRFTNCYLTDAGYLSYLLGTGEKVKSLPIDKIEGVKELLSDLEAGKVKVVNYSWGYETKRTNSLKINLKKQLREIIRGYENGGTIQVNISVKNE